MSKRRASLGDRPITTTNQPRLTDDLVMGKERMRQEVEEIALRAIMPNHLQPRTQPNPEGLHELADSIRQHGVLEPIIVRAIALTDYEGAGRRYELIAGERRWRASAIVGRDTIPAIVVSNIADDRTMLELAITENLQREDLHPLDEAMAFGRMQSELGYSYAQIAERLGKSKGYVQNRMRLLQLKEDLQQLVAERPDTLAHVYEIARVSDPTARTQLIADVRNDTLSRAATRARVQALLQPTPAVSPETEAYFQKYDRDVDHEKHQENTPKGTPEAYFQKYDRANDHKVEQQMDEHESPQATARAAVAFLTEKERSILGVVLKKIEHLLDDAGQLTEEDWVILSPLALRLSDLLRRVGQAQTQHHS